MNIQIITETGIDGTTIDFVIIDRGNGEFTSMTKADYEASTLPSNSSIPQAGE
jgi:hypothetical protein